MAGWGIDLRQSHVGYYYLAKAYKHIVNPTNTNTLRREREPIGSFYCKEVSPYQYATNEYGEVIQVRVANVTIETPDFIGSLESNDFVSFKGKMYIVVSVQKKMKTKQEQLGNTPSAISVIGLRGE